MGWGGVGWGGVGHINIRLHLRHDASVVDMGWGMLTFVCICVTKLMLRG